MNRRAFLSKFAKIGAAVGLSGTALVALDDAAEAGCYRRYTGGMVCSHNNWYALYQNCCTVNNGQYACGSVQREWRYAGQCWL